MKKQKKSSWKNLLVTLILAIAVVAFWRGVWILMDLYLFPNDLFISAGISLILGIFLLYSIKHRLDSLF